MKIFRVYKDIATIKKSIIPVLILNCILSSIEPFIFIVLSSFLVKLLLEGKDFNKIVLVGIGGATFSLIVYVLKNITENLKMEYMDYLNAKEKNLLIKGMYNLSFKDFDSKDCKEKISRHREETDGMGGIYYEMLYQFSDFFSSLITIIISVFSLWKLFFHFFKSVNVPIIGSKYFPIYLTLGVLVFFVVLTMLRKKAEERNEVDREKYAKLYKIYDFYGRLLSNYESLKQIKIYDDKKFIHDSLEKKFVNNGLKLNKKIAMRTGFCEGINEIVLSTIAILFLIVLSVKARGGLFNVSILMIYYGAFNEMIDGIKTMIETIGYQKGLDSKIDILYSVLDLSSNEEKEIKTKSDSAIIDLKNVFFSYQGTDEYQLNDINIQINEGEKIAIVGANGSGKTTFINLLTGLYNKEKGEIFIDGVTPNLENTNSNIGVVSQDFYIFPFKLGENVASNIKYNEEKCNEALKKAMFKKDISLDNYIYSDIDDSGIDVSGGEAQKIALARAIYGDKKILLFDEPTSKLDPEAEMKVFESFNEVSKGKTALFVSHRMSACKFADRVILFKDGKIDDFGTHDELYNRNKNYSNMWDAQAKYFN